jgi:predicted phage terminase large subunit-like protein
MRIKKRGDFNFHKFKALIQLPERMDMWDKWERILKEDKLLAENFYKAHKKEMDAGAKVLWPDMQPVYYLMEKRAASRSAFASEYQNEPLDEELAVFKNFQYFKELPKNAIFFGAVDPALGKTRGDFTAIVIVAKDMKSGKIYVAHAEIGKFPPLKTIDKVIDLQNRFHCQKWAIEEVAFQEFFKTILIKESRKKGTPVPVIGIKNKIAKEIRIESLGPHVENGTIIFDPRHNTLIEQLQFYPLTEHDDGPDALEMAFRIAYKKVKFEYISAKRKYGY